MFADNEIDIIKYLHIFYSTQLSKIALFPRESKELISVVEKYVIQIIGKTGLKAVENPILHQIFILMNLCL